MHFKKQQQAFQKFTIQKSINSFSDLLLKQDKQDEDPPFFSWKRLEKKLHGYHFKRPIK